MRITQEGNVGIGTTSPSYLLSLSDSDGADLGFSNSSTLSDGDYLGRIYGTDSSNNFFTGINMFYHDSNDGEMRFRIKTAGISDKDIRLFTSQLWSTAYCQNHHKKKQYT